MDIKLAEKYFDNECTPEEARKVLNWFATEEGEQYLKQRLDDESRLLQDERLKHLMPEAKSQKMWNAIDQEVGKPSPDRNVRHQKTLSFWYIAAAMLIVAATSVFYFLNQDIFTPSQQQAEPAYYATTADQHKKLTLGDGTHIRLNKNSQLWISESYGADSREVRLEGEAFFEIVHDEERPFIIHTGDATIKDLGTAFNVRAFPDKQSVQVAVTEGKVSLWSAGQQEAEARELVQGQYGYLDLENSSLEVDEFGVSNYLSWMNGRFKFKDASLQDVCKQLNRIYGVSFGYADSSLKTRQLTTNFERDSMTKVLDVIALTLDISYEKNGQKIMWSPQTNK